MRTASCTTRRCRNAATPGGQAGPASATAISRRSSPRSGQCARIMAVCRSPASRPHCAGSTGPLRVSSDGSKAGARPGYPRFKGKARFDTRGVAQDGDGARWHPDTRRVYLQGVGQVKVTAHRDVVGRVKTIQIRRQGRRWMLILSCDDVPPHRCPTLAARLVLMSGSPVSPPPPTANTSLNPRWARSAAAGWPPRSSGWPAPTGSNNRGRRRETVAARHRKIANCRRDFHHKTARTLVTSYELIALEDLAIANMVRRARPVPDPDDPGQFLPEWGGG